jgi:hypothetical protein
MRGRDGHGRRRTDRLPWSCPVPTGWQGAGGEPGSADACSGQAGAAGDTRWAEPGGGHGKYISFLHAAVITGKGKTGAGGSQPLSLCSLQQRKESQWKRKSIEAN